MLATVKARITEGHVEFLEAPPAGAGSDVLVIFMNTETPNENRREMKFGELGTGKFSTLEDFKDAEWHGEDEFAG